MSFREGIVWYCRVGSELGRCFDFNLQCPLYRSMYWRYTAWILTNRSQSSMFQLCAPAPWWSHWRKQCQVWWTYVYSYDPSLIVYLLSEAVQPQLISLQPWTRKWSLEVSKMKDASDWHDMSVDFSMNTPHPHQILISMNLQVECSRSYSDSKWLTPLLNFCSAHWSLFYPAALPDFSAWRMITAEASCAPPYCLRSLPPGGEVSIRADHVAYHVVSSNFASLFGWPALCGILCQLYHKDG